MRPTVDPELLASVLRKARSAHHMTGAAVADLEAVRLEAPYRLASATSARRALELAIDAARAALADLGPVIDSLSVGGDGEP